MELLVYDKENRTMEFGLYDFLVGVGDAELKELFNNIE